MAHSCATGFMLFFTVYGSEAILRTELDYGVLRVRAFDEQGKQVMLGDAMDQVNEAHDVVLLRSAKY